MVEKRRIPRESGGEVCSIQIQHATLQFILNRLCSKYVLYHVYFRSKIELKSAREKDPQFFFSYKQERRVMKYVV
jgi:hypothetical protein